MYGQQNQVWFDPDWLMLGVVCRQRLPKEPARPGARIMRDDSAHYCIYLKNSAHTSSCARENHREIQNELAAML